MPRQTWSAFFEEGDSGHLVFDLNEAYDVIQQDLAADFDGDGDIDNLDMLVWEQGFGAAAGGYDGTDFLQWQQQLVTSQPGDFDGNGSVADEVV